MAASSSLHAPRFLDEHIKNKVQPATLARYRKQVGAFMLFVLDHGFEFQNACELDDLLAEWKRWENPSRSDFDGAVAGIEFAVPQAKHHLPWAHAISSAWGVTHQPRHTVPMTEGPAVLLGCHLAARGHGRLGAGLIIQSAVGLRPGELLGLQGRDVTLPEDKAEPAYFPAVMALGARTGTKVKRAQTVVLGSHPKVALLRWLRSGTGPDDLLIGGTYESYRNRLAALCESLGLSSLGFTPHSPRSGFASDCVAKGISHSRIRELGRWASETSLRTYIDVASASAIAVHFKLKTYNAAVSYTCVHMLKFFVGAEQFLALPPRSSHATSGLEEAGRSLDETRRDHGGVTVACLVGGSTFLGSQAEVGHTSADDEAGSASGARARVRFAAGESLAEAPSPGAAARGRGRGRSQRRPR